MTFNKQIEAATTEAELQELINIQRAKMEKTPGVVKQEMQVLLRIIERMTEFEDQPRRYEADG